MASLWPRSIALRMTVWYALLSFTMVFAATGILYWVLVANLEQEDNRILADHLANAQQLLRASQLPVISQTASEPLPRQPIIYLRVVDSNGHVLLQSPGLSRELPAPTPAEIAALTSSGGISHTVQSLSGRLFEVLEAAVADGAPAEAAQFVQVAMDRDNERRVLKQYRERMWVVLSLSLVLCSGIGYGLARTGMRPIANIARTAERVGSSTLHERIGMQRLPAELSSLAETFNSMLDRLEDSFARVSQFSDDVAHELRTPINNLRGEMEVALSKARTNEDYQEILGSCLEESTRISRLIEKLLFLARAENSSEPLQRDDVDVEEELRAVQEFYEPAAAEAGVELRLSPTAGPLARVDRTLFQQAVANLVSNAISHTPAGGVVRIGARCESGWLEVDVTDNGRGIPPAHLSHVFDRFYRIDQARTGSDRNVGLGLAIVKSIVGRHGGKIAVDSELGRGTRVRLQFPA